MSNDTRTIAALQAEIERLRSENIRLRRRVTNQESPCNQTPPDTLNRMHLHHLLTRKAALTHLIMTVSNRFITIDTDAVQTEIDHTLQMIGLFAQVDVVLMTRFNNDATMVNILCEWYACEGGSCVSGAITRPLQSCWLLEQYRRGRTIAISRIADLPPAAEAERDYCDRHGIRSFLGVPIYSRGVVIGDMFCATLHHERIWLSDIIDMLKFIGEVISGALQRKQVEDALRASEEHFRAIFDYTPIGIAFATIEGQITESNPALQQFLGYTDAELRNVLYTDITHADDLVAEIQLHKQMVAGQADVTRMQKRYLRKDSAIVWGFLTVSLVRDADGTPLFTIAMVEDMTRCKQAEAALQQSERRLRELTQKITMIQEEERGRLSRELHDESSQALVAIFMSLRFIQTYLPEQEINMHRLLADAIYLTHTTMERLKALAYALRPPALDTLGLDDALTELGMAFARNSGLAVDMISARVPDLPDEIGICLYRFVQEALTNIAKHACDAQHVWVELSSDAESICVTVEDDGHGITGSFEEEHILPGMGLLGMHERLRSLGGSLEICTHMGQGMRVQATIPLSEDQ